MQLKDTLTKKNMLFGPPGIGKSTLVEALGGVDLERIPSTERFLFLKKAGPNVFGSADLNPKNCSDKDLFWIVLKMPQDAYERRRAERDKLNLKKRNQPRMLVSDFDLSPDVPHVTIDVSGDLSETADQIKKFLK